MEAMSVEKKKLHISPAIQALIIDIPEAVLLLERLKLEQGYEVQDVVDYGEDKPGVIGHIVTTDNSTTTTAPDYVINSVDGIVQVLSKLLSPANSNAPHSPPAERGFQQSGGEPPKPQQMSDGRDTDSLLRKSGDGRSIDGEEVVAGERDLTLTGLKPESKSFVAKWCSWFTCGCDQDEARNPLLSSEPGSRTPTVAQKK